jgi:predicted permease
MTMPSFVQDLRFSLRQFMRNPGFTLTAVISLALGIGATTAIFSVLHAGLLHPYPYRDADRIVTLSVAKKAGGGFAVSPNGPQIKALQESPVVEKVLITGSQAMNLTGGEFPENVSVIAVNGDTFTDLGVPPVLGRGILPSDTNGSSQAVAVLSYKFWRRYFLSDPKVLERTLELGHRSYQIVGVAAPRFTWAGADVYQPLRLTDDPDATFLVWLRLKPGVTYASASVALQPLIEQFARQMPKRFPSDFEVNTEPLNAWVFRRVGGTLYTMFGAVLLLLVIGCGNVSILLLAQGTVRQHELAVRAAIGASRGRILRQLLNESLLLAAIGAALGICLSYAMLAGIRLLLPPYAFPSEAIIHINLTVLLFSVGLALATGVFFGIWPALQLSRIPDGPILQFKSSRITESPQSRQAHNLLIAGQIAMTLLLLAASGSAMKQFIHMLHRPLGYDPQNVMSVGIPLQTNSRMTWEARLNYFAQLREKVAETPGVTNVAISIFSNPPRSGWEGRFEISGKSVSEPQTAYTHLVSSEFFSVLRIPFLRGRQWSPAEDRNAAPVAVINRAFAQCYFPDEDPLAHSLTLSMTEDPAILEKPNHADSRFQVIGVVEDFLDDGLNNPVEPAILVPYTYKLAPGMQILVRSTAPPLTLVKAVKTQLAKVNPDQQTLSRIEELSDWISNGPEWQREHLVAWIFGIFAWLALALAGVGLYSVVSYSVARRRNEFGIRMALGAQRGDLLRLVYASAVGSVGGGIATGLGLSVLSSASISRWTQGDGRDPEILCGGIAVLSLVAAAACLIPALRAAATDPMKALRTE